MKTARYCWTLVPLLALLAAAGCKTPAAQVPEEAAPAAYTIKDIFAGASNVFFLPADGTFWSLGDNSFGQLGFAGAAAAASGTDTRGSRIAWEAGQVFVGGAEFPAVISAASGETHTVILMNDATVWGAGASPYGELGQGVGNALFPEFARLKDEAGADIGNVKIAAAGNNSSFLVMGDNSLWASGYNYYGGLGLGDRENRAVFTRVESAGLDVAAVAAGVRHTVVLKTDGTVWTAGYNFNGQLGLDIQEDMNVFTRVEDGAGVTAIAAGNYHTVILKNDGSVWTAGDNYYGQLGDNGEGRRAFVRVRDASGALINDAAAVSARGDMTLIQRKDGSLLVAGNYNEPEYDAQSGPPPPVEGEPEPTFIRLEPENSAAFGAVKKAVLGNRGIYVLTEDGFIWTAGSNRYGQLFLGQDVKDSAVLRRVYPRS